jgi:alpha-L-fucosidase
MNTPYAKDILKQLTDACHKAGIKVIFYYSKPDWSCPLYDPTNPKPYEDYMVNQIRELCTNYGEVKGFWWDGGNVLKVDGKRVAQTILSLQPGAIYNDRGAMGLPGQTFSTPEQKLGEYNRWWPWETCATVLGEEWFWNGEHDVKSVKRCLKMLVSAAVGDGNLLLNFGPAPDGTIPPKVKSLYLGMGRWLKQYGESIYGTRGGPYKPGIWGGATCKGNIIYLHITQEWPDGELHLPKLPAKIMKVSTLTGGKADVQQTAKELIVKLPRKFHDEYDTVIKLELDRDAFKINPFPSENVEFISMNASVTASSEDTGWRGWAGSVALHDFEVKMAKTKFFGEDSQGHPERDKAFKPSAAQLKKFPWVRLRRDHIWRFWRAKATDKMPWLEINFGQQKTFNKVTILEKLDRIKYYKLQYQSGDKWITFHSGTELSRLDLALEKPITTQKVRLKIIYWTSDNREDGPGIRVFDFWLDKNRHE